MDIRYLYTIELVNKSSHHLNDTYVYKYTCVCVYIYKAKILQREAMTLYLQQQQDGSIRTTTCLCKRKSKNYKNPTRFSVCLLFHTPRSLSLPPPCSSPLLVYLHTCDAAQSPACSAVFTFLCIFVISPHQSSSGLDVNAKLKAHDNSAGAGFVAGVAAVSVQIVQ